MLYAIADIHGRFDLLSALYTTILEDIKDVDDPSGAQIIFLGDYVDRGPQSKEVLDFLMGLKDDDHTKHVFLFGNHEDLMCLSYHGDKSAFRCWSTNGGEQTLASFGITVPYYTSAMDRALKPYVEWMESLSFYYTVHDYVFCHSGSLRFDFDIPLEAQKNTLTWGRVEPGAYKNYSKWVIHGHTPTWDVPEIEFHRVNMDTGGWYHAVSHLWAGVLPHGPCQESDIRLIEVQL